MEISNILLDDEQVSWTFSHKMDLHKKLITNISVAILGFLVMTLILLIIGIFVNQLQAYFFGLFWIGLIFGGSIIFQYRDYALLKKKLDITNEDLKAYQESFYFTNRRCILKSYKTFKLDLKKFPNHEINKDYFILKHEDIKTIIVSSFKNLHIIWISEKYNEKTIDFDSFVQFKIPSDRFEKFFEILKETLPIEKADKKNESISVYIIKKERS